MVESRYSRWFLLCIAMLKPFVRRLFFREGIMKLSILAKIIAVLMLSILVTGLAIFLTAQFLMKDGFEEEAQKNLIKMESVVSAEIDLLKKRYLDFSALIAENPELINGVLAKDIKTIAPILTVGQQRADAQFIVLTDNEGTVLYRTHSPKRGDSILRQAVLRRALSGQSAVNIERGSVVRFSIRAASPIRHEGKIIGGLVVGESIDSNRFVDRVKKVVGVEMTIFESDNRVSTTLTTESGTRAVGTKLTNKAALDAVLVHEQSFAANSTLFSRPYKTLYWPLKDMDGKTIGMWFIGLDHSTVEKTIHSIGISSLVAMVIIVFVIGLFGILFSLALLKPLKKCVFFAQAVSAGSLNEELQVKTRDEIGVLAESLRTMVNALREKITESEHATVLAEEKTRVAEEATRKAEEAAERAENAQREGMLSAAAQLEGLVTNLTAQAKNLTAQIAQSDRSASESSQRLAEAAAAMQQMNATVQEVAQNASNAANVSVETKKNAEDGQEILRQAFTSIDQVHKVSLELQQEMGTLHGHTQNISQIMSVISDIADQTNLLALNAAIEAARAGEAGRGFAVVADEVRKLAEKTMASTNDVSQAISAIQTSAEQSVNKMGEAIVAVDAATSYARQSGEALTLIVGNVENTADQVHAIATASEEQSASSAQITQSIAMVNEMASQSTQAMNEAAKAVTGLAEETNRLSALIVEMKQV